VSELATNTQLDEISLAESGAPELCQTEEPENRALFLIENRFVRVPKKIAPTDELTGMPLPVLPPKDMPSFDSDKGNWHHHYHPSNSRLLTSTAGLAVRHVRLQYLPIESHHNVYHSIFEGPALPLSNQERLGHIVLACVGYIPPYAIDVHSEDPTQPVHMTKRIRRRLQSSGEIEVRGHPNISNFIKNHLIRQDFSHVDESLIEEFVTTRDIDRRRSLGNKLLRLASEMAVEPIKPVYQTALKQGLVTKPKKRLPNLVKSHIDGPKTSHKARKALHKRLAKAYA
jgi:hypothetical protein